MKFTCVSTINLALVMEGLVPINTIQSSPAGTRAIKHLDISRISSNNEIEKWSENWMIIINFFK